MLLTDDKNSYGEMHNNYVRSNNHGIMTSLEHCWRREQKTEEEKKSFSLSLSIKMRMKLSRLRPNTKWQMSEILRTLTSNKSAQRLNPRTHGGKIEWLFFGNKF